MKSLILTCLIIIITFPSYNAASLDDNELFWSGRLNVCFSAEMIGNSLGRFEITNENGIIVMPDKPGIGVEVDII